MTSMKDEIHLLNGKFKIHMCRKQENKALQILSEIINRLSTNQHQQDVELKEYLTFALIDRINLNFKNEKFNEVVLDVQSMQLLGFDIYNDKEIFLIYNESKTAIHNDKMLNDFSKLKLRYDEDIENVKENIIFYNAKKVFDRKNNEPKGKKRKELIENKKKANNNGCLSNIYSAAGFGQFQSELDKSGHQIHLPDSCFKFFTICRPEPVVSHSPRTWTLLVNQNEIYLNEINLSENITKYDERFSKINEKRTRLN
ncbi:unnamed protein product [Rotaria magnacalcarata]|uniref:Uncharacterized protein n=1 Tax=Rotaria magnacalcarata TaxID=392030 RepID=A0A816WPB0_9BILA|nr:unnamed protein product [Rotaria magnacalcarata]